MPSSIHRQTPSLTAFDSRGLPVRQVEYLRTVSDSPVQGLITRLRHDAAGYLLEQLDPRLSIPNLVNVFGLSDQPLKVDSVDAGPSLLLPGLAGEEQQRWDAMGNHWHTHYDRQLRPISIHEDSVRADETLTYAGATADPALNLRGNITEMKDPSGLVVFHSYGLTGPVLRETRTFHDNKAFTTLRTFGPTGTLLEQTDAGGHKQQSTHDVAGQLQQHRLQLKGDPGWQTVLHTARYNAAGQITEQLAGNGVISRWLYDQTNGRLHRQIAQTDPATVYQDLEYRYDRVGNITDILDHGFTPRFFANQRVTGDRTFTYDSLYRLHSATGHADAPPSDNPGRPQPTDPSDRRLYTETYDYDAGNNLIKTIHVREGAHHTREVFIDPVSNRGVRWKPGDPTPDFNRLYSPAGDLLTLQPGMPLHWNRRGQLETVTLVDRNGSSANDEEFYRYSQGERVYKRHETHTTTMTHFHETRYLPGLEIRIRDNGEQLHRINLACAMGSVVCLHWLAGKPPGIAANQLRYTLTDHLGSGVKELDAQAQLISDETYLPFGASATLTARSAIEVDYKTLRYSGKEMDVSGLYDYGARHFAPWLGRWISADPAGDVDGLNLYAFVGNNPMVRVDADGRTWLSFPAIETNEERDQRKAQSRVDRTQYNARRQLSDSIDRHINILGISMRRALDAQQQILNHRSSTDYTLAIARRTTVHIVSQAVGYGAGVVVGIGGQALNATAPGVGGVVAIGMAVATKKAVSLAVDYVAERTGASASVKLKANKLSPEKIIAKAEYKSLNFTDYVQQKYANMNFTSQKSTLKGSKEIAGFAAGQLLKETVPEVAGVASATVNAALGVPEIVHEVIGAGAELSPQKIAKADNNLAQLIEALETNMDQVKNGFSTAQVSAMHTFSYFGDNAGDTVESLQEETNSVINELRYTRTMLHSRSTRFSAV